MVRSTTVGRLTGRLPALVALLLPVLGGLACMAWLGAPRPYLLANGMALLIGAALLLGLRAPATLRGERALALALLALLFAPLLTGPAINGIARWLPLGPVSLHAGMLAIPVLTVMAARDADYAAPLLLLALLASLLQPDAASAFAITIAAVGIYHAKPDWKLGVVALVGFFAMIIAALRGELPAQPVVERVLVQYAHQSVAATLALFAALVASFALMANAAPLERPARLALAGSLFGFTMMALMSNYPSALIGHGAAPIIGYGLALGLVRQSSPVRKSGG
jgi:cell division protein FtsW (lipid II flippase)